MLSVWYPFLPPFFTTLKHGLVLSPVSVTRTAHETGVETRARTRSRATPARTVWRVFVVRVFTFALRPPRTGIESDPPREPPLPDLLSTRGHERERPRDRARARCCYGNLRVRTTHGRRSIWSFFRSECNRV